MPLPYHPTVYFAELDQAQKDMVLKDVAKEAAARFKHYIASIKDGVGLPTLTAADRLEAYRVRQPDIWARLQASFPFEYERQKGDWHRLETDALRRAATSRRITQSAPARVSQYEEPAREGL